MSFEWENSFQLENFVNLVYSKLDYFPSSEWENFVYLNIFSKMIYSLSTSEHDSIRVMSSDSHRLDCKSSRTATCGKG